MQPSSHDAALLWDMLDAAQAVHGFVRDRTYADYLQDRLFRGGIERHIEIIGEAAGKVSRAFRDAHPDIPWDRIISQRHVLAHNYGDIEHPLMWAVATERIPELIAHLEGLIPPLPPEPAA